VLTFFIDVFASVVVSANTFLSQAQTIAFYTKDTGIESPAIQA
jgi:hypothetical protein